MYKNILCAVDITPEGDAVLNKASLLAEKNNATLYVVHVIEYSFFPKDYQKELEDDVSPKINKLAKKYSVHKKNCYIKFGQGYREICELAEKKDCDLIILGNHSKSGIQALMGSTANAVIQHAVCDVLLIKKFD